MPKAIQPYLKLMRLDRPTGIWMLLFPCWWGLALSGGFDLTYAALFAMGAIIMRGAGCTLNDLIDYKLDQQVYRTAMRPIASHQVSLLQAFIFLGLLLLLGFLVLIQFPWVVIQWGILSLPLVLIYPFMKRLTYWPQLFLGITSNWGVLLGYAAVTGVVDFQALALYFGAIFWMLGHDTIYALQDIEDDIKAGIKSTAIKLHDNVHAWLIVFYSALIVQFVVLGIDQHFSVFYFIFVGCAFLQFMWQVFTLDATSPQDCLKKFRSNTQIGWLILIALLLA